MWRRSDALAIEADLPSPGYVVLLEAYERGWRAGVDGEAAEVLRANVVFRAVAVPAGKHVVEFRYRPPGALAGASVSLVALLGGGLALVLLRRRASL